MTDYTALTGPELTALLKAGDEAAFTAVYRRYSVKLYSNVLKMVRDETTAEEIVQEVFTLIWQKRETIMIETSFSAYLYRITQNQVYDFFRKVKRDKKLYEQFTALATEHYADMEEAMQQTENRELLEKALSGLTPQQKKVYELCRLDGYSYKEAATQLSISPHTVKEYLVKANKIVKDHLLSKLDTSIGLFILLVIKDLNP